MSIRDLKPQLIWEQFDDICQVPRPSKKEGKIIAWLQEWAKKHNFDYQTDETGNVVIRKAATKGFEGRPAVILQSHMDMVCEKNSDVEFDFENDPIQPWIDGEWVKAKGTTLGADCGIGMAAALAVLLDDSLEHPAIEALFTVDEETGLTGAFGLGEGMLTGKYLVNLDSEDEGELFIGCAGGIDTVATMDYDKEEAPEGYAFVRLEVGDLLGGHSGDDIDKGRGNSNKLLARFLYNAADTFQIALAKFDGGNLRNAIPREAYAIVGVPAEAKEDFEERFLEFGQELMEEFKHTEPRMRFTVNDVEDKVTEVMSNDDMCALLITIVGLPNGVLAMSFAVPGLVETSSNLASVKFNTEEGKVTITTSQRSSVESAKLYAAQTIESVFFLAGFDVEHSDGYPGWSPNPDSKLLATTVECYRNLFATEPKVRAIHAGLECGLFLEKYPHLEMVSFGPTLRGVHSPDERLEISTVDKFWKLLVELLKVID
ncbi:MAG: aminoacyl-histidine dipeptidase [Alistipes sp.]|nr:aminoacyl-histidine dipeptidase [Alistipes sp.]MBQ5829101.1 aminoacyl-histidine dipeptidase [Alistipes sp.]MBR2111293.1 aminoacyl-histidine dipeptidase [Alistipes sp.]